jgi:hypothetical protein
MASNVFVSFDHDDQKQVGGFKLLKNNPNHPLDFQDHSLKKRRGAGQKCKTNNVPAFRCAIKTCAATKSRGNSTVHQSLS